MKRCLLVLVLIASSACAGKARHAAVVVDAALYESLNTAHQLEQRALCGQPSCAGVTERVTPQWTDARSQGFNKVLLPAVGGGREFNTTLANWKTGEPLPTQAHELINSLAASLAAVTADFPVGDVAKLAILTNIAKAQSLALTALGVVLTLTGGQ